MERKVFFYKGKRYEMTDEEIEAGYYFRQRQNLYEDAKRHLMVFILGDEQENVSSSDQMKAIYDFEHKYKMEVVEAARLMDKMIARFEKLTDCNIDENSTWNAAIWDVLQEHKRN